MVGLYLRWNGCLMMVFVIFVRGNNLMKINQVPDFVIDETIKKLRNTDDIKEFKELFKFYLEIRKNHYLYEYNTSEFKNTADMEKCIILTMLDELANIQLMLMNGGK